MKQYYLAGESGNPVKQFLSVSFQQCHHIVDKGGAVNTADPYFSKNSDAIP